jgi:hypothetical protein
MRPVLHGDAAMAEAFLAVLSGPLLPTPRIVPPTGTPQLLVSSGLPLH